jgi:hypothetical protein
MKFILLFIITLHVILYIFAIDLFSVVAVCSAFGFISLYAFFIINGETFLDEKVYRHNYKEWCKNNYKNYILHKLLSKNIKANEIIISNGDFADNFSLKETSRMARFLGSDQNQRELAKFLNEELEIYGFKLKDDDQSWKNKFDKQCVLCRITTNDP